MPHLAWFLEYGRRYGLIRPEVQWERAGAFLIVRPQVLDGGRLIRLELVPELRAFSDGRRMPVRFTRAATEVVVQSGQTVQLGALHKDAQFYRRFLVGRESGGTEASMDILLTPRIMPQPGGARRAPQGGLTP